MPIHDHANGGNDVPGPLPRALTTRETARCPQMGQALELGSSTPLCERSSFPIHGRLHDAAEAIRQSPPSQLAFLHAALCNVTLPRSAITSASFHRSSGWMELKLTRDVANDQQGLPYGTLARLILIQACTEAVRTRSPYVHLAASESQLARQFGLAPNGGSRGRLTAVCRQLDLLSMCRIELRGMDLRTCVSPAIEFVPIFARLEHEHDVRGQLSLPFYESLIRRAVPLDPRALAALRHSALAMDVYLWLTHRLGQAHRARGTRVSWQNLREQFGQEYQNNRDFKRAFGKALTQAVALNSGACAVRVTGGILLGLNFQ